MNAPAKVTFQGQQILDPVAQRLVKLDIQRTDRGIIGIEVGAAIERIEQQYREITKLRKRGR